MPEISRFLGIIVTMFADDHNPPHLHVEYGEYKALVSLDKFVVRGEMPRKVLRYVFEWMDRHGDELQENWRRLRNGEEAMKIKPLI